MQKRKLSDMLGSQWSKEEIERFYEAYRKYGKDWRKVWLLFCPLLNKREREVQCLALEKRNIYVICKMWLGLIKIISLEINMQLCKYFKSSWICRLLVPCVIDHQKRWKLFTTWIKWVFLPILYVILLESHHVFEFLKNPICF